MEAILPATFLRPSGSRNKYFLGEKPGVAINQHKTVSDFITLDIFSLRGCLVFWRCGTIELLSTRGRVHFVRQKESGFWRNERGLRAIVV